ncbi:ABC transporter [Xylaria intraflava]|nr:ABC transporter [Xylaria intraflava]
MAAELSEKAADVIQEVNSSRPSTRGGSTTATDVLPPTGGEKSALDAGTDLTKLDSKVVGAQGEVNNDPYQHLPEHEAMILKKQITTIDVKTGYATLYRYATRNDLIIIFVSTIAAIAAGAALPVQTILFGHLQGTFEGYLNGQVPRDHFTSQMDSLVLNFVYLAIGEFVTVYIATVGFIYTGEHISAKIREHYLESCMRQNIGFFDSTGAGEVTTRITADINLVQEGLSEKVSLTLSAVATFGSAFVIGFAFYWKLALILTSVVFALLFVMGGASFFVVKYTKQNIHAHAIGGSIAEEVLSSIRNTVAFGTENRLAEKYDEYLKVGEYYGFRKSSAVACMVGGIFLVIYLSYGLSFWVGSSYLIQGIIPLSTILTVMLAIVIGAYNLGNIAPNLQAFGTAVAAAAKIFNTIDRVSPLDPTVDEGKKLDQVEGSLRLQNVRHIYPSRPEVVVMKGVTLDIPAGKTTALVGASGSGKSTIVGLVERFYDPVAGQVLLDGHDISTLNLRWLRQQISLVSQEPTLFGTTIFHNIRYGLFGTKFEDESAEKQRERVIEAAKKANAHDFISALPEGYETNVGERGFLLSGGQKQRIAIARAVVSDPKILLLDEATSALDTKSEGVVQAALEAAAEGRTTITIAHRLSTIKDAHNIVVMSQGAIIEQGNHNDLLLKQGAYYNLVTAQNIATVQTPGNEGDDEKESDDAQLIQKTSSDQSGGRYSEDPDDNIAARLKRSSTQGSISSRILKGRKSEELPKYGVWTLVKLIASFNKEEWKLMIWGLFWAIICGGGNPAQALFFAKQILTLGVPITDANKHQVKTDSDFWSLMYLVLAFVLLIAHLAQGVAFAKCSEVLIHRVRDRAFRAILRQDVAFFDKEENTAGALTSFLSTETTHLSGLSGVTLGTLLTITTTLVSSIILGLAIGWKLALVCVSAVPLIILAGYLRYHMLALFRLRSKTAYEKSASFASEAISAIRTVASLTREADVLAQYRDSLALQQKASLISILKSSLLYATSQATLFLAFALGFWYGGTLIADREYNLFQFFVCFMAVVYSAQSAGAIFAFAPDMGKARQAACELKTLFDRKPTIDTWSHDGEAVRGIDGKVEFRDVHFRYPTRPGQPVLRGLNLTVNPGQYVALVGSSGCGKSTTIALLERFYDALAGGVFVDGKDISSLNIKQYRSFIALVSQEPTLYQGTIKENILLGTNDEVTDEAVEHACREANIFDFIMSLPEGFNTVVGTKGALLSGGQKQRIAIARALVRDPRVLLLDEATSALDSESEHVVQAALDKAARGRTTIAIAHRLSTIQRADVIYVFDQGRIVESGTHSELMHLNGRYAELVNLQSLQKHQ